MKTAPQGGTLSSFRHVPELDGARAMSVVFVLLLHISYGRITGGFLGVDVFFVLSGFLITKLLMAEYNRNGRISLKRFYSRRFLRIIPPLLVAVLLGVTLSLGDGKGLIDEAARISAVLLFYANFLSPDFLGNFAHTWSLSIEEQYYLVWPLMLSLAIKGGIRWAFAIAAVLILACVAVRFWMVHSLSDLAIVYSFSFSRFDSILMGSVFALAHERISAFFSGITTSFASLICWVSFSFILSSLVLIDRSFMQQNPIAFSSFAFVAAVFLASSMCLSVRDPLRLALINPVAQWLGKRSYGLYLYHYPIFLALEPLRIPGDTTNFMQVAALKLALSLLFTEIAWAVVEKPVLQLRKRYKQYFE